jgi:catechol 2,3-dioxygenase-like lactoylglutathione lyase family enzyme
MPHLGAVTPILRIFDEAKTRAFYVDFLGFKIDFEHRFGENFPLYMGASLGDCTLHLSEHHGDACPGTHIRIRIDDIASFVVALQGKNYRYAKPGAPEKMPWGSLELTITDPSGNRLTFIQDSA